MTSDPLVSVVIPTYNRAGLIRETIESVRRQTYARWELIVVDDGSTDDTETVLGRVTEGRIRYVSQANAGQGAARNRGVAAAAGELLAFLDSDDQWHPGKLESQVALFARRPDTGLVYADAFIRGDDGMKGRHFERVRPHDGNVVQALLRSNFVVTSTVAVRRRLVEAVGGFDEDPALRNVEDYDLWLRLAPTTCFASLCEPLATYRVHPGNTSRNARATLRAHGRIYRKVLGDRAVPVRCRCYAAGRLAADWLRVLRATP